MPNLAIGAAIRLPDLAGRWSVWSQSDESPGAFFVVPMDDEARESGIKFAVVRATVRRSSFEPELILLRTDPPRGRR